MVRRELAALLRDLEATAARGEHDGRRVELVLAARRAASRCSRCSSAVSGLLAKSVPLPGFERVAQRLS